MPLGSRRKTAALEISIGEMILRVVAPENLYEEIRAAGLQFWELLQSYGIRHREFRTSKRPVEVPEYAPAPIREIAEAAGAAGVGPVFTLQGAVTEHVGRFVARLAPEVLVSNGGDYYVLTRKRAKLVVHPGTRDGTDPLAVVVKPELGPQGIYTTMGRLHVAADTGDALVVVASSCIVADAAAAAASAILSHRGGFAAALTFLRRMRGVHGAMVIRGERIGLAGALELAA